MIAEQTSAPQKKPFKNKEVKNWETARGPELHILFDIIVYRHKDKGQIFPRQKNYCKDCQGYTTS